MTFLQNHLPRLNGNKRYFLVWACLQTSFAMAAADVEVIRQYPHGSINWSSLTVTAKGIATPQHLGANLTQTFTQAESRAKEAMVLNFAQIIGNMVIDGELSVSQWLAKNPKQQTAFNTLMESFEIQGTRYYADGGVDITGALQFDNGLVALLNTTSQTNARPPNQEDPNHIKNLTPQITGVVINAKGIVLTPSLAPLLVTKQTDFANLSVLQPIYTKSLDAALAHPRVAGKPVIVRALGALGQTQANIELSPTDAATLQANQSLIEQGHVLIVLD